MKHFFALYLVCYFTLGYSQHQLQIDSVKSFSDAIHIVYASNNGLHIASAGDDGIDVYQSGDDGIFIQTAGDDGILIQSAGDDGIEIQNAQKHGMLITNASVDGIYIGTTGNDGILIQSAGNDGIEIQNAQKHGMLITNPSVDGIYIGTTGDDGMEILKSGDDGIFIGEAGRNGFKINYAGTNGLNVTQSVNDGIYIGKAGDEGVHVNNAGTDGIYVHRSDGFSMNIQGDKNYVDPPLAPLLPATHIAQIYNRSTGIGNPNVLALKVGNSGDLGSGVNFITFYNGDDQALGSIEGNGSGGITYNTSGADFAEYLEPLDPTENIQPGDVVGIFNGKVSLTTSGASEVMVITDRPAVLGNKKNDVNGMVPASFIGQVSVKVIGAVKAGDWIVASGKEDGSAIAVPPSAITLDHQVVGRAWENNPVPGLKKVNVVVGLDQSVAKDIIIRKMKQKIIRQEELLSAQTQDILDLKMEMNMLKKLILDKDKNNQ